LLTDLTAPGLSRSVGLPSDVFPTKSLDSHSSLEMDTRGVAAQTRRG